MPKPTPGPESKPAKVQLQVHPIVASMLAGGQQQKPPVRLAGYIGDSGTAGRVRLYPTLYDLSQYLEFDESAVVRTAPAPSSVLPQKGLCVWVNGQTAVRAVREVNASDLASALTGTALRSTGSQGGA